MRTIVDIPPEILERLDRLRNETHRSRAALIREALAEYTASRQAAPMEQAFGLWKTRGESGMAYQKKMRTEWEGR